MSPSQNGDLRRGLSQGLCRHRQQAAPPPQRSKLREETRSPGKQFVEITVTAIDGLIRKPCRLFRNVAFHKGTPRIPTDHQRTRSPVRLAGKACRSRVEQGSQKSIAFACVHVAQEWHRHWHGGDKKRARPAPFLPGVAA